MGTQRNLRELGFAARIGIATGPVYAGLRGSPKRRDFGLIGDIVNLSARLTNDAAFPAVCNAATRAAARGVFVFESLQPVRMKGKTSATKRYRPISQRVGGAFGRSLLQGRNSEVNRIAAKLRALENSREGGALMIQGEPGIGKSRLVQWVLDRAAESTSRTTVGAAEPYSRAVPYRPWIAPLNQILRLEGISPEARRERVRSTLPPNEDVDTVFSLLDSVLVLGAEIDKTTSRLTSQSRAERIVALLTHLVCESVKTAPAVIVLEDAHWMDSPSWELAAKILRAACPVLFVVTTRPTSTSGSSSSRKRFLQSPNLETLTLGPLTRDEVLAIACERLDVDALPRGDFRVDRWLRRKGIHCSPNNLLTRCAIEG